MRPASCHSPTVRPIQSYRKVGPAASDAVFITYHDGNCTEELAPNIEVFSCSGPRVRPHANYLVQADRCDGLRYYRAAVSSGRLTQALGTKMTAGEVERLVEKELREFRYQVPEPWHNYWCRSPWYARKGRGICRTAKSLLIRPYLRDFLLADTYEQTVSPNRQLVTYWVVVETPAHYEFYEPFEEQF